MSFECTVAELELVDAGRGIARLDPTDFERLGVGAGAVLRLTHGDPERRTRVRALPTRPLERSSGIWLDRTTRENLTLTAGAIVTVAPEPTLTALVVALELIGQASGEDDVTELMRDRAISLGDQIELRLWRGSMGVRVLAIEPPDACMVGLETRIVFERHGEAASVPRRDRLQYDDIGGLEEQVERVRELIELPLRYPAVFERLGIQAPRGVLLSGAPGTGKTLIARAVALQTKAHFIAVAGPEIVGKYYGDSEKRLREVFEEATRNAPSIVFLDEIDAIAPKRDKVEGEVEKRIVAQLLTLMDGLASRGQVVVIAATNRPNALDPALRRPGRFDREVAIRVPDRRSRLAIIKVHTRGMPLANDVDLERLAERTPGFVGADLAALTREAAMHRLRSAIPQWTGRGPSATELLGLEVGAHDFEAALRDVTPSAIREVDQELEPASWSDIGGLEPVKARLRDLLSAPLLDPQRASLLGVEPPRGILLTGAPGTGKTLTARALAAESSANFITVTGAQLLSKFYGESEDAIRSLFARARNARPCIVFIDEIDALLPTRDGRDAMSERIVGQFLTELDGAVSNHGVIVLGATNRPEAIDPAVLRSGRLEWHVRFELPDALGREQILALQLRNRAAAADLDLRELASQSVGASGADLAAIVRSAARLALRDGADAIAAHHLEMALTDWKR